MTRSWSRLAWLPLMLLGVAWAAPNDPVLRLACEGDLRDSSGRANDGFTSRPRYAAGQRGQGLHLAGAVASVPDCAELRLAPGLRIEGWVRFEGGAPAGHSVVTKDREYMLRVDPAGEGGYFSFFVHLDDWEPRVRSTVAPRVGEWYHWIAAWDGRELLLDINGTVSRAARAGQPRPSDEPVEFGPLEGVLDEVSLTNPAASQSGVAHWAFGRNLLDDSGGGHHLTRPDARFDDGRADPAVRLDAPLSTPDSADLRLAPGLRIDCAVRFERLPSNYGYLVVKEGEYQLRVDSPGEGGRFSFFINVGGWEPRVQSPVKAEVGVWYRLTARWNGQVLSLDVNGRHSETMRSGLARPGTQPLVLGPVAASLDDLRIENPRLPLLRLRALTQEHTLLRAGQPERLAGLVENLGSYAADVSARLELGRGLTCSGPLTVALGALAAGESRPVEWTVRADASLSSWLAVQLEAGAAKPPPYRRTLAFYGADDAPTPPVVSDAPPGTTWYVDGLAGDNARAGTSPATAWRDFANINDKVLGPGERLLIRRGSVINQELRIGASGTAERWAEIGAYGEGARPIVRRDWDISQRCAWVRDPDCLRIRGLVFAYAGKGLVVQYRGGDHAGLVIEDCLAHHIEGLYRTNAHGIPEWLDREGAPGDGLNSSAGIAVVGSTPRDVLLRDCEMYQCSWGFFVVGDNVTVDRVFCHDNRVHNTSPHPAMVAVKRSWLINSLFDAPGWHASAGTMGIMLVDPQGLVIRNCTFRNQPDSGSHDEGAIDFENQGNGCLIDRCTFERNAGAAIEVLGLQTPQPRNVEITRSRFIQNNLARKLGPAEIFVFGSPSADVCCSTGSIHGNGYVLNPGIEFFVNQAPKLTQWSLADNAAYGTPAELRRAMPLNDPPTAEAGADIWTDRATVALAGRVTDDGARPPAVRWEMLEGPGAVTFAPAGAAATSAALSAPGDYLLRLVADDGELWHSDLVAVHRLPAGATTAASWDFGKPGDRQGWSAAALGTKTREWTDQAWPTRSEPVNDVAGGFYLAAIEASADAHLLSPTGLNLTAAAARVVRLRLMNHTPATRLRLRFTTAAEPAWDEARSVWFAVTPNDTEPRVYTVPLPTWTGQLGQLRLDLAAGQPNTGTCRLDYVWVGAAGP